jgi:hypothetical protein
MTVWNLASTVGDVRSRSLNDPPPYEVIVEGIRAEMQVLCCHPNSCQDIPGFDHVIYCIRVGQDLFDLFFNSRNGYRAAYWRSPYEGLSANATALSMLTPTLLASSVIDNQVVPHGSSATTKSLAFIEESLRSPSAKLWLVEPERGFCKHCNGEWTNPPGGSAPEIINGRWEHSIHSDAQKGGRAPYYTKLRVQGAFLNSRFDEAVPERKRFRAQHIHERGWA